MNLAWNPKAYSQISKAQKDQGEELLKKIEFDCSWRVLDVGCGNGSLALQIAKKVNTVTGVDASYEMIEYAKKEAKQKKIKNIHYEHSLLPSLQDFGGNFDLIFSNATIHWIKDKTRLCQQFYRILKPSGKIFLRLGATDSLKDIDESIIEGFQSSGYESLKNKKPLDRIYPASKKEFQKILVEEKFKNIDIEEIRYETQFDTEQSLSGWILNSVIPWIRTTGLSNTQIQELCNKITHIHLKKHGLIARFHQIIVTGEK